MSMVLLYTMEVLLILQLVTVHGAAKVLIYKKPDKKNDYTHHDNKGYSQHGRFN
jgi:hypothetical protein